MLLILDSLVKLTLVLEFFYNSNLIVREFDTINFIRAVIAILYLILLRNSSEHYSGKGLSKGIIGFSHTLLPCIGLFFSNVDSYSSFKLFLIYFGVLSILGGLIYLNDNFAVIPFQNSRITEKGPYALVRHPIYFGHLTIFFVGLGGYDLHIAIPVSILYLCLSHLRMNEEEVFLIRSPEYKKYTSQVSFRLIPFVY